MTRQPRCEFCDGVLKSWALPRIHGSCRGLIAGDDSGAISRQMALALSLSSDREIDQALRFVAALTGSQRVSVWCGLFVSGVALPDIATAWTERQDGVETSTSDRAAGRVGTLAH
jgi:hypothetical protein